MLLHVVSAGSFLDWPVVCRSLVTFAVVLVCAVGYRCLLLCVGACFRVLLFCCCVVLCCCGGCCVVRVLVRYPVLFVVSVVCSVLFAVCCLFSVGSWS